MKIKNKKLNCIILKEEFLIYYQSIKNQLKSYYLNQYHIYLSIG